MIILSKHVQSIKDYEIDIIINTAKETVEKLKHDISLDNIDIEYYDRFMVVISQAEKVYTMTDPYMITDQSASDMWNAIDDFITILNKTTSENFYENMKIAQTNIDSLIESMKGFIFPRTRKEVNGYSAAFKKYKELIVAFNDSTEQHHEEIRESIKETAAGISSETIKFNEMVDEVKSELESVRTQFEEKIQEYYDEAVEKLSDKLEEERNSWSQKMEEVYSSSKRTTKEIEGIAGALSPHSMAYSYKKIADDEQKKRDSWNKATIVGFVLLFIYGATLFSISFISDFSWSNLMGRLSLALGIGAFIAYAARQASIHGQVERYCRETEIELASLNPYFAEFRDNTDRLFEIKAELSRNFFGKGDIISSGNTKKEKELAQPNPIQQTLSADLIKLILDIAKKQENPQ